MRNGRVRCDFYDRIGYSTIKEEKKPDENDAIQTAQASASASASTSKSASGGERGRNKKNNKDDKSSIIREKDISDPRPWNLVSLDTISLVNCIQTDIERAVLDLVSHYRLKTNAVNLCVAGGMGFNSVCNG